MTTWTSGYVADLAYTHGYYRELQPQLLRMAALSRATQVALPQDRLSYCELGCGQGFSANLLAAANPQMDVHAMDFNPAQIAGARALAAEAGTSNVHFHDHAFAEFGSEPTLPDTFDIIALHGIYSWISPENRRHIVEFIRRRLRVGGLLYISYNTLPGWAPLMPLRQLLVDQANLSVGSIAPRIEAAISFAEQFQALAPAYFAQNPLVAVRFDKLKGMSRNYLAHEYFNRDWTPFYFTDVAAEMAEAKLSFVASAHLLDHVDSINLSEAQQKLLAGTTDPNRREGLRDYLVNQQFRRDVFIKGAVPHSPGSERAAWLQTRFALSSLRPDVPTTVTGARGEATLQAEVYGPLLDALAGGAKTVAQIVEDKAVAQLGWPRLIQALTVLVGSGHLQPALPAKDESKRRERTRAFNAAVWNRARSSSDLSFLASPVTGGGVPIDRFGQLFLAARAEKHPDPVAFVWDVLNSQGQRLLKDGKPLENPDDNIAELRSRSKEFEEKRVPVLQQLGIA